MARVSTLLILMAVTVGGVCWGHGDLGEPENAAGDEATPHFLWRAVGPQGTEVFLLGSIHALPQDAYPLPEVVENAFEGASVVVFEVDLSDVETIGGRLFAAGALKPGQRLQEVLSPPTRALLKNHLEATGLSDGVFEAMKPWMAALTLTTLELMKAGYSTEAGLDLHFARRAAADDKQIEAFESAAYQIALFADMSAVESESFLRYTLRDLETVVPQLEEITRAWREGDVAALAALLTEAFEDEPDLFDRLVTKRNGIWLPKVRQLLEGPDAALVVVGALHLVGPTGLVRQLEAAGYVLEQL